MIEQHLKNPGKRNSLLSVVRGWGCPDEATLAAFADGQLEDTGGVEEHLAECHRCRQQVSFLVHGSGLARDANVPPTLLARAEALGSTEASSAVSPAWRWATAAAVTACLVLAISLRVRESRLDVILTPPTPPSVDSSPTADTPGPSQPDANYAEGQRNLRSAESRQLLPNMLQPREGAEVSGKLRIQWQPVKGSLFYEIRVTTAAGDPVWQSDRVSTTVSQLPPAIQLIPGEKYFAWVVAYFPEGKTIRSRAVAFTVRD